MLRATEDALTGESDRRLLIWRWIVAPAAIVAAAALCYVWFTREPPAPNAERGAVTRIALTTEQRRISDDVGEAEREYQRLTEAGATSAEMTPLLERAIRQQRDLLQLNPLAGVEHNVRLERLLAARDSVRARELNLQIATLHEDAEREQRAGRVELALEHYRAALALQREVDQSDAEPRWKNFVRELALEQAIETFEAKPLHEAMSAHLASAAAAVQAERWTDALGDFSRARELQAQLNEQYPRTRYADLTAVDRIEGEIASLQAAGVAEDVVRHEQSGDAAAKKGRNDEAAEHYRAAGIAQRKLNHEFARSRFVSTAKIDQLEIKRQTVLAAEPIAAVATLDRTIASLLLKRQAFAAEKRIADALELIALVEREFPKGQTLDPALKLKLSYLGARGSELRVLQDTIYERLAPIPGEEPVLMFKTEVSQEIYQRVMSTNPSRHAGRDLPVDSVNWLEAQEFCRRLSWVLGTRVRLPRWDELQRALGDGEPSPWNAVVAKGATRGLAAAQPNDVGFADLLGNVAEWIEDASEAARAQIVGGSYLDPEPRLTRTDAAQNERARHVGFRIVVELAMQ
ncbi:MAG: formylglycine-generating enzyme family protein [Opitutus sp.]|nr:formylglycine-generating enzyme family protein [Opitutus sp.]